MRTVEQKAKVLTDSEIRAQAIEAFWEEVERLLTKDYNHSGVEASQWIGKYKTAIKKHKFGDVVFNQGEQLAAEAVHAAIDLRGFPDFRKRKATSRKKVKP
jgi:uncharacterized membrane-anchored protein YjiN (DUF445 family)